MQYVLFGSGSKVSTLTDRTDGKFDNIFGDKDMTSVNKDAYITPNVIYLEYLKDVTKVADKLKNISFIFSLNKLKSHKVSPFINF